MSEHGVKPIETDATALHARILVVEDDALVASYIKDVLEETGFVVSGIASTAGEAFALVAETLPRLALVDIRLPGTLDGIEVARELLKRFNVHSIFLSGIDDPATLERAKIAEPLGFLHKPFRPSQVFNALERALEKVGRS
ncbi:MAG: response regulator [Alphaproteobacteria bacterium]|nr:response regulator [Alphaproteobacteria bacterium]